jgi:predicted transposase YbfD/YdcC
MNAMAGKEPDLFEDVETLEPYNGYYFNIRDVLLTCLLGSICGLSSVLKIWTWAKAHAADLFEHYQICLPERSQFYLMLSNLEPESLKKSFEKWVSRVLGELSGMTVALDGKTIRSTEKMANFEKPLHIVTAFVSEIGMSMARRSVAGKTNEIPTVQELLQTLALKGCVVTADAMHCQTKTAQIITGKGADYLLSVRDNQPTLKADSADYVQDELLRKTMKIDYTLETNGGRIEKRTAYITDHIAWLENRNLWSELKCIGAICSETTKNGKTTVEWSYYITSKNMSASQLLHYARAHWGVESLHWLLDVHFDEDRSLSN